MLLYGTYFNVKDITSPLQKPTSELLSFLSLGILGFATHQTFESTTYDEICQAFLKRSKKVMRNRELAMEQAQMKKQNKV